MERLKFLFNMCIAYIVYLFKKDKFKNKNIWLIGGHSGDIYNDNSKFFYEYILEHHKEIDIYWVIGKNSTVKNKIPGSKLIKGSVENYLYYYNAKAVIFSHSPSADIAPFNFVAPYLKKFHYSVVKVYLNHGTISFKKRKAMNGRYKTIVENLLNSYDISTASSEFERDVMVNDWDMNPDSVFIVGNARYDNLPTEPNFYSSDILFTPTWRDWVKFNSMKFTDTEYFKDIMAFLNNDKLNEILEKKNIKIKFYMHHLMHEFFDEIKSNIKGKRVIILSKDIVLADEIKSSAMNITDYSSVSIDFLYMNRPILFYQFDIDEYIKRVDSYIDLRSEMFGYLAYNGDEVVTELIRVIENGFEVLDSQKIAREKFFKYNDNKNCSRIYDCIVSKLQ